MAKQKEWMTCSYCHGSGLYKRHTSYTRDGKPFCFKCDGVGKILVSKQLSGAFYHTPIKKMNLSDSGRLVLVPAKIKKNEPFLTEARWQFFKEYS